jgi:hypothetical protein
MTAAGDEETASFVEVLIREVIALGIERESRELSITLCRVVRSKWFSSVSPEVELIDCASRVFDVGSRGAIDSLNRRRLISLTSSSYSATAAAPLAAKVKPPIRD